MGKETLAENTKGAIEQKTTVETGHKIHKTHFPVIKIPLQDDNFDSGYEWVPSRNGRLKLVPKRKEE